jgi:hypothetical protein
MTTRNVISRKNLPAKSPILLFAVTYLVLDKWHASPLVYGIIGTLYAIILIAWIIDLFNTKDFEIFELFKGDLPKKKFSERVEELKNERKVKEEKIFDKK